MEAQDSLPYIDPDISQAQRDEANLLVRRELPRDHQNKPHPSLPDTPASHLAPLMQQEVERVAAKKPLVGGIDLGRYEESEDVSSDSDIDTIKAALRTTYANISYLRDRQTNISLLEEYGKNSWLIGNSHMDDIQKHLDNELVGIKAQSENTNKARKALQENAQGELLSLTETWNRGIDKIIQTQLASDTLKQEMNQLSRHTAPTT